MSDVVFYLLGLLQGLVIAYILWAPETAFKKGFVDGLSLKWIWGKK